MFDRVTRTIRPLLQNRSSAVLWLMPLSRAERSTPLWPRLALLASTALVAQNAGSLHAQESRSRVQSSSPSLSEKVEGVGPESVVPQASRQHPSVKAQSRSRAQQSGSPDRGLKPALKATPSRAMTVPIPVVLVQVTAASPVTQGATGLSATASSPTEGTYQWSIDGGVITAGQGTPAITYSASLVGTITLECTVTDGDGLAGSSAATVSAVPAPVATITTPTAVPSGASGLTALVPLQDGCAYAWAITGGTITDGASSHAIVYSVGNSGSLTLTCTVTNEAGDESTGQALVQTSLLDVSGTYKDSYNITFTLFQDGTRVWGTRPVSSSISEAITATLAGNVLTGTFLNSDGGTGNFRWTFTADAGSYTGLWAAGSGTPVTGWNGTKQTGVSIQITPTSELMQTDATQAFQAFVAGSSNKAVAWTATNGALVDANGVFTAPAGAGGSYTVTATSGADVTKSASAVVMATPTGVMDVSGTYKDSYGITFTLFQNGTSVWGTRPISSSLSEAITATLVGNVLTGTFLNSDGNTGNFRWTFAADAGSYTGLWAAGSGTPVTGWNGTKQTGVSIQITPTSGLMQTGGTKGFQAFVAGSLDKNLTYSATGGGSIAQDGTYTAPAIPCNATITATPEADPTKAVTAKVEVTNDGLLDVSGTYYSGNYTPFHIVVYQQGTSLTVVPDIAGMVWQGTLNGLTATGTIVASTTPAYIGTGFTLTFSPDGSSLTGYWNTGPGGANLGVGANIPTHTRQSGVVSAWIAPTFQVAKVGSTAHVTAISAGSLDKNLTYSATGGGSIAQDGTYTAPAIPCNATITATPEADPTKAVTAKVEVTNDGLLDVSGTYYSGNYTPFHIVVYQQGTSILAFADIADMVWSGTLNGLVATGTIVSSTTLDYRGKGFTLTFSQDGSSLTGYWNTGPGGANNGVGTSIPIHTRQPAVTLRVQPDQTTLFPTWSLGLSTQVAGSVDKRVTWAVQEPGGGAVNAGGTYTAPAQIGIYHAVATTLASPTATATATIQVAVVGLQVVPAWIQLRPGAPTSLTAMVQGVPIDAVAWSVREGAAGGSVDTAGRYTPPTTPGTYHVVATSLYDPTQKAVAEVHVGADASAHVTITPYASQLGQGGTQQFAASVSNASNTAVTWTCNGGAIDPATGLYTAPDAYGNYTVTATSVEDPNATDTASVVVSSGTGTDAVFTYDLNGNMTSDGTRTFEWDAENRLVAVTKGTHRSEFGYDGFGHRVEIRELDADANGNWVPSVDTKYVWEGAEILESRSADGITSLQRYYDRGFLDSDGTALYYTKDHLGSTRELVDAFGAIRARYDYDLYGRMTKISGDKDSPFLYTRHLWHAYSGLYLTLYREYDANLGRWISRDPAEGCSGINLYNYVENNPTSEIDKLGLYDSDPGESPWEKQGEIDESSWDLISAPFEGKSLSVTLSNANTQSFNGSKFNAWANTQQSVFNEFQTNVGINMPEDLPEFDSLDEAPVEDALSSVGIGFKILQVIELANDAEVIGKNIKNDLCNMVFGDSENAEIDLYFDLQRVAPGMAGQLAWSITISKAHHYY